MVKIVESYLRWEPLPGLPEHPFNSVEVRYRGGALAAAAYYANDPPAKGIRIDFGRPEAFKVYEEFSDPWMEQTPAQPMIVNSKLKPWVWPLQEIRPSAWLRRVLIRNGGLVNDGWKHLVVITSDVTLHVMAGDEPRVELIV